MTLEEAIALRQDQLSGKDVDPFLFAVALRLIQGQAKPVRPLYRDRVPRKLLELLTAGPLGRDDFCEAMEELGARSDTVKRLRDKGLIKDEVRLTHEGLRALGLQGPGL